MKSYIEIANRTCRVNVYKHKKANKPSVKDKYIWTAKKGDASVSGGLAKIAETLNRRGDQVLAAYYRAGWYLGYTLTRSENV